MALKRPMFLLTATHWYPKPYSRARRLGIEKKNWLCKDRQSAIRKSIEMKEQLGYKSWGFSIRPLLEKKIEDTKSLM